MVIIIARIEFDPDEIDALQPALDAMMRATWDESGCLSYSMAVESREQGICTIVERWESEAVLKQHFATPHMTDFNAAILGHVRSVDARLYDVTGERALMI